MKHAHSIWHQLPLVGAGQSVGLLGGSFDPAHAGHVHITQAAFQRFDLDHLWWLVSPGNPLKSDATQDLQARVQHGRAMMDHPRVHVTGIEAALDTRYTANTLRALTRLQPRTRFVWLMGADNLVQFHHWQDWQFIMHTVPVGVLARPGSRAAARNSVAARRFATARIPGYASQSLGHMAAPAWCFVNIPLNPLSSTALRQARAGQT